MNLALVYAEFEVIPTMQERQPDWTVLFLNASKVIGSVFGPLYRRALFYTYLMVYQYIFVPTQSSF